MTNTTEETWMPEARQLAGQCWCDKPCSVMWLRTTSEPRFYVCELRGVCFVTFVPEKDKANSANFPTNKAPIQEWKKFVESIAGCELEAVTPFV